MHVGGQGAVTGIPPSVGRKAGRPSAASRRSVKLRARSGRAESRQFAGVGSFSSWPGTIRPGSPRSSGLRLRISR